MKNTRLATGLILLCGLGLLALAAPVGAQVNESRTELLRQDRAAEARARQGHFVDVLASMFAPEGVYVSNLPQLGRGPTGARAWLERDSLNASSSARWTVLRAEVSADGRDGYTYGYFDVTRASGDSLPGRYHAYWRRNEAGVWQILAFSRGRRPPGPLTQAVPAEVANVQRPTSVKSSRDTTVILREVFAAEGAFCDSAGVNVGAAFGGFAAPDAGKLGSSEYVFGKAAITALFAQLPPGNLGPAWKPEWGSAARSGDLAFTLGPAWPRVAGKVQVPPEGPTGRYFTVWRRQPDGSWRYLVD